MLQQLQEMGCNQILKYVIRTTKMCYRSICRHPLTMGILLLLLFLYRSSPFLFSLFVSASPVLVCTAVLLGTLLSFGETNNLVPEKTPYELGPSKTIHVEGTVVVGKDEFRSSDSKYTDFRRELVSRGDDELLADNVDDELHKCERQHDGDVGFSLMNTENDSRDVLFEDQSVGGVKSEIERNAKIEQVSNLGDQLFHMCVDIGLSNSVEKVENEEKEEDQSVEGVKSEVENNLKIEQVLDLGDQLFRMGVEVGLSSSAEKVQNEEKEEYKSLDGSVDSEMGNHLRTYLELEKHENFEHYKSPEGSLDVQIGDQIGDQLEPSLASWQQLDGFDDALFPSEELQDKRFEDHKLGEGSSEAQLRDYLESSLRSWKPVSSDQDEDDESDYGSDGAESSSPDASMADIIPMLDELHPLLEDEIPQAENHSRHSSNSSVEGSVESSESSIHSEDESDHTEDEAADVHTDVDDEIEKETQARKDDSVTSPIMWTEDDQKNLMDLGTSELERNYRLESLIARRRARKMMADNNLIDFDGMDLPFPVAPIATRKQNPFDYPHESYDDLGLPPVPGSAPSIMFNRRNPFDLPYDPSEEKPDLTGDSFQQEFVEIARREVVNQREAMFRRNETFSMGSSAFDFARPSRFRPYFVPERTDSDGRSYSSLQSLQRQFSELSESKASSVTETESTSVAADQELKKQIEHDFAQEAEPSSVIDQASVLVQHGSQSSEDLNSLSCEEKEEKDFALHSHNLELGSASFSPAGAAYTPETGSSADNRISHNEFSCSKASWLSHSEGSHSDILMAEFIDVKHNTTSSSLFVPEFLNENKLEDVDNCLGNIEQNLVNDSMTAAIPKECFLESVKSDASTEQTLDASDISHAIEVENKHRKEPIYDLSPLKKDRSLSSQEEPIYDLQRETSGIDLYHLSSKSLKVDESYVHNDVTKNNSQLTGQDSDGNSLTKHDMGDGNTFDGTDFFSELNQLSDNFLAVAEDESHLNSESSDRDFDDEGFDRNLSSNEAEQSFAQKYDAEIHVESELNDNRSVDDMPSSNGCEFVKDFISVQEKNESVLLAEKRFPVNSMLSCSQVVPKAEVQMEMELNQQHNQESSSRLVSHGGDENELLSLLNENHFSLRLSDMHDPLADLAKQPEHDEAFACQSNRTSSHHEENSIAELAIIEHLQDTLETRHAYIVDENHDNSEGFIIDEPTPYERKNEGKGMDEVLLSELDSVGDFRVLDVVPNITNSMTYSTAAVDSSIFGTVHSNTEKSFVQNTYLADTTLVAISESDTGLSGTTVADTMEPNLDSHAENVTNDLLVLEPQYVDDIDAGLMEVREDTQKSVVGEPFCSELTGKEDVSFPETELLLTEAKVEGCTSGVGNATADVSFHSSASVPRTTQSEHSLLERNNLHRDRRETDPQILLLDAHIMEHFCENVEKVVDKVDTTYVEALETAALTEVDSIEFESSRIERKIRKTEETSIPESPEPRDQTDSAVSQVDREFKQTNIPMVESSIAPALEPRDQAEGVGSMEFESSQIDGETEEIGKAPSAAPVLLSGDQIEGTGFIKFESSHTDRDTKKTDKTLLVETRAAAPLQTRDQIEASQIIEDSKETGKTTLVEASIAAPDPQSRNLSEGVGVRELKSSHADGDTEEMNNKTVLVEASTAAALEPRDQADGVGTMELASLQVHRNNNEIQESSVLEASNSLAIGSDNGCETLEMPVHVAKIAPKIEPENQKETITSEPLLLRKESKSIHESTLDGTNIISTLNFDSSQIDRAAMDTMKFAAGEGIIAVAAESENQKGTVGSSDLLQLDINIPKLQGSPGVEADIPSAHEPEVEKEYVGYPESQQLQVCRDIEESILLMMSESKTARTAPPESESLQMHTNIKELHHFPTSPESIAPAPVLEDQSMKVNHEESKPLLADGSSGESEQLLAGEAIDAPVIKTCFTSAFELEGQQERIISMESQQLQVDGNSKEFLGSNVLETSYASDFKSVDEIANNSQTEVVGVLASQDQQLVSEPQPEADASSASDLRGNHGYHQPL